MRKRDFRAAGGPETQSSVTGYEWATIFLGKGFLFQIRRLFEPEGGADVSETGRRCGKKRRKEEREKNDRIENGNERVENTC